MIRTAPYLLAGIVLGGIVHLGTILALPSLAPADAYSRLSPRAAVNTVVALPAPASGEVPVPFLDPAFAHAVCRYDLTAGPIRLRVPVATAYTAVAFYSRTGEAYYGINDRAAGRRRIEVELMTRAQRLELPEDEDITAADRLIVESPTSAGLVLMRALAPEPGVMPTAVAALAGATCETIR